MTNPKFALPSTEFGRWYEIDGEKYVSVTNVIEATESAPHLLKWAAKKAIENNDVAAAEKYRNERAERGDAFHTWAEQWGLGLEPPAPLGLESACVGFLQMVQHEGVTVEAVEATVFHPELGYAGTLDALLRHPKHGLLTTDYKTGKSIQKKAALQLTALRQATKMILPDGQIIDNPPTDGGAIVHVTDAGSKLIPTKTRAQEWEAFNGALKKALWQYKISKEVFRP